MINDLNVRPETKTTRRKHRQNHRSQQCFFKYTLKAQATKAKETNGFSLN